MSCGACSCGRVLDGGSNLWLVICAHLPITNVVILVKSFHHPGPPPFSFLIFKELDEPQEYSLVWGVIPLEDVGELTQILTIASGLGPCNLYGALYCFIGA